MSQTPDGVSASAEIAQIREQIENVDHQIVQLLGQRVSLARRIGEFKRVAGTATLDPAREAAVLRGMVELARSQGLHTEDARDVFWAVIGMCRRAQTDQP